MIGRPPHLERVLLQVVRLPEPDVLDVVGQAAAAVVAVVQDHALHVTVQHIDSAGEVRRQSGAGQ